MRSNGFDLMKLANALREQGRYRDLSENIERAYTAASAATDLHRVKNSLDLISKVQKKGGAPEGLTAEETGIVIAGQFLSAVITYSRATVSKPIARRLWWSPATLPPELKSTHDLIIYLRNKEFAHFGKGRRVGEEPLLTEILYLALGSDSPVNFRSSQWSTRPEVIPEFSILNDHVLHVAKSKMNSGFIFIAEKIAGIVSYDNSFWDLAGMSPIDISSLGEPQGDGSRDGKAVTRNWTKIVSRPMGKLAISDDS